MTTRTVPLNKEHGVWVLRTGKPLPASVTDELLQRIREERDLANLSDGFVEESRPAARSKRANHRPKAPKPQP